jgi:hypothetical protein
MDRVVRLGCLACRKLFGISDTPAEIHHVRENRRKRNHKEVLPLCPLHHRSGSMTIHFHKRALLQEMGVSSEQELLEEVEQLLSYH